MKRFILVLAAAFPFAAFAGGDMPKSDTTKTDDTTTATDDNEGDPTPDVEGEDDMNTRAGKTGEGEDVQDVGDALDKAADDTGELAKESWRDVKEAANDVVDFTLGDDEADPYGNAQVRVEGDHYVITEEKDQARVEIRHRTKAVDAATVKVEDQTLAQEVNDDLHRSASSLKKAANQAGGAVEEGAKDAGEAVDEGAEDAGEALDRAEDDVDRSLDTESDDTTEPKKH